MSGSVRRYPNDCGQRIRNGCAAGGYHDIMGDREHPRPHAEQRRPLDLEGTPAEEDLSAADAADRVDLDPEEQVNRPNQPGVSPEERRQFIDPPERSIAESTHPEDR